MKENDFFNFQRALTAMLLRDKLRKDGLGIYEQQVLNFLGSKTAHKTIPPQIYGRQLLFLYGQRNCKSLLREADADQSSPRQSRRGGLPN
jgi:hypothetical protein